MSDFSMTASELTSSLKEDFLQCAVCEDFFRDPRALNCLHTFCHVCLCDYVKSKEIKPGQDLDCPLCRQVMTLPDKGVDGLRSNHWIKNLADLVKETRAALGPNICMMCSEKAPSVVQCLDCSSGLCQHCKDSHQRMVMFQSHCLITNDDIKEGRFIEKLKATPALCDKHRMPREYFCNDESCNFSICVRCKAHNHDGHNTIFMRDKVKEEEDNLTELSTNLEKAENLLKSEIEKGTSASSRIDLMAKGLIKKVKMRGDNMKKCIQNEVDALISVIKKLCQEDQEELNGILDSVEGNLKKHQSAHQLVMNILNQSCHEDLVTMAPDVVRELSGLSSEEHEDMDWDKWRPLVFREGKHNSEMFKEVLGFITREKSGNFQVGEYVRLKENIPISKGDLGRVTHKSVGFITEILGDDVRVDFPEQKNWKGDCSQIEHAKTN